MNVTFMTVWYVLAVVSTLVVGMEWVYHAEPGQSRLLRRQKLVALLAVLFIGGLLGYVFG